jgi:DNA primase
LPARVKTVVLALDGDAGGKAASQRLAGQIEQAGLRVENCSLTQESCGKDWNEHWRLGGRRSLTSVFGAFSESWSA